MSDFLSGWLESESAEQDKISVKRVYIDINENNLYDAVLFSQIMYWHGRNRETGKRRLTIFRDKQYWLAKRYEDWFDECRIDADTARKCITRMIKRGLLVKQVYHFDGKPMTHIRVDGAGFEKAVKAIRPDVSDGSDTTGQMEVIPQVSCYNTETPTETTEETTSLAVASGEVSTICALAEVKGLPKAKAGIERGHLLVIVPKLKKQLRQQKTRQPLAIPMTQEQRWREQGLTDAQIEERQKAALAEMLQADRERAARIKAEEDLYAWVLRHFKQAGGPNSLAGKYVALFQCRPSKSSKKRQDEWADAILSRPVTALELEKWAKWYRQTTLGGDASKSLAMKPELLSASINGWIALNCPDMDNPQPALTPQQQTDLSVPQTYFQQQTFDYKVFDDDGMYIGKGPEASRELERRRQERAEKGGAA